MFKSSVPRPPPSPFPLLTSDLLKLPNHGWSTSCDIWRGWKEGAVGVTQEEEGGLGRSGGRSSSPGGLIYNGGNPELAFRGPEPKPWELAAAAVVALRVRGGSASAASLARRSAEGGSACGSMLAPSGGGFADWSPRLGFCRALHAGGGCGPGGSLVLVTAWGGGNAVLAGHSCLASGHQQAGAPSREGAL